MSEVEQQLPTHRTSQSKLFSLNVLHQYANSFLKLALRDFGMLCPHSDIPPPLQPVSNWLLPDRGLSGVAQDPARKNLSKTLSIRYEFSGFLQLPSLGRLTNLVPKADTHAFCPCISNQLTPCGVEG